MLVQPDDFKLIVLGIIKAGWGDLRLRLFKNNVTPTRATVIGDLVEADFPGYTPPTLDAIDWSSPSLTGDFHAQIQNVLKTFTYTGSGGSNDIYGYYVTAASSADLKWVERNDSAPVTLSTDGESYSVLPRFTYTNESEV